MSLRSWFAAQRQRKAARYLDAHPALALDVLRQAPALAAGALRDALALGAAAGDRQTMPYNANESCCGVRAASRCPQSCPRHILRIVTRLTPYSLATARQDLCPCNALISHTCAVVNLTLGLLSPWIVPSGSLGFGLYRGASGR